MTGEQRMVVCIVGAVALVLCSLMWTIALYNIAVVKAGVTETRTYSFGGAAR